MVIRISESMTMSDLYPWLEPCRLTIATAISQGRLPHALLLTGLPGLGKGVLAEAIARQLLCEAATLEAGPCGRCTACAQISAGSHPDYIKVQLEEDARVIKVDQIRWLAEKLSFSSHQGGYKVVVLDPAGNMNINAANSLLKTLEEPSDNTVLVLVCERSSQLPPTVRSRCQQLRVEVPGQDAALHWLAGQGVTEPARTYLQMAHGAPLEALKQARADSIEARRVHFDSLVDILEGRSAPLATALLWSKEEDMQGLRWMRDWLMDLLRIGMTGQTGGVRSADLLDRLARLARRLDSRVLFAQLERINRALGLVSGSLNRQLQTEDILLAWAAQK
jgi:DNA polymerase-3 subunit delta'